MKTILCQATSPQWALHTAAMCFYANLQVSSVLQLRRGAQCLFLFRQIILNVPVGCRLAGSLHPSRRSPVPSSLDLGR